MTRRTKKWLLIAAGVLTAIAIAALIFFVIAIAPLGTRYVAKRICAGVFLSGRDASAVWNQELQKGELGYPGSFGYEVDKDAKVVSATWYGVAETSMRFLPGLGCIKEGGAISKDTTVSTNTPFASPFPFPAPLANDPRIAELVDEAMRDESLGTRALVVVHRGEVVAESYANEWAREMPQLGWSMTKSITQVLIGMEVHDGHLSIQDTDLFEEWKDDERTSISLLDLLQMSSGLAWEESYTNPFGDAIEMLFDSHDMAKVALDKELEHEPGSHWSYSSGTSNLLMLLLRRLHESRGENHLAAAHDRLFAPLGMKGAIIEPDPSGTLAGSSYGYAPPIDWARFGQFVLQDGVIGETRHLPSGWRALSCTPAPNSKGVYGAHFWLRVGPDKDRPPRSDLPADICHAAGHEGQYVTIVPSKELVVVRMGLTRPGRLWDQEAFVAQIATALSP